MQVSSVQGHRGIGRIPPTQGNKMRLGKMMLRRGEAPGLASNPDVITYLLCDRGLIILPLQAPVSYLIR